MKRVAILHPDLGIGGAEALIISVALALQQKGYDVTVYTPFFDPNRCLKEAHQLKVSVKGNWVPRAIFGRGIALCAYLRMLLCALYVVLFCGRFDWYVIDQVSLPVPLLRCRSKVLFYCHHPDKLLCTNRQNWLMKLYRLFLDFFEEITTFCANVILVNSAYTRQVFRQSFKLISRADPHYVPDILYPSIDLTQFENPEPIGQLLGPHLTPETTVITSLNRYERKKDIPLAIKACQNLPLGTMLVIAGGYDPRVLENVEHHLELVNLAKKLQVKVVFLRSISSQQKVALLARTDILLYTPENEHFGIVPCEAMYTECTVIAQNSGGPLESIVDGQSGYLLPGESEAWHRKIVEVI